MDVLGHSAVILGSAYGMIRDPLHLLMMSLILFPAFHASWWRPALVAGAFSLLSLTWFVPPLPVVMVWHVAARLLLCYAVFLTVRGVRRVIPA